MAVQQPTPIIIELPSGHDEEIARRFTLTYHYLRSLQHFLRNAYGDGAQLEAGIGSALRSHSPFLRLQRKPGLAQLATLRSHLEIRAGAPTMKDTNTGTWATRQRTRTAERELAKQAEASYKRMVSDWQAAAKKEGASVTPGRASSGPLDFPRFRGHLSAWVERPGQGGSSAELEATVPTGVPS